MVEQAISHYQSTFKIPSNKQQDLAQEVRLWIFKNLHRYNPDLCPIRNWVFISIRYLYLSGVSKMAPKFPAKCKECLRRDDDFCYKHGSKTNCKTYLRAITKWSLQQNSGMREWDEYEGDSMKRQDIEFPGVDLENFDVDGFVKEVKTHLTRKQKQVFDLLFEKDLTDDEISERMGYDTHATKGNWTTRWHRKNIFEIAKRIMAEKDWTISAKTTSRSA